MPKKALGHGYFEELGSSWVWSVYLVSDLRGRKGVAASRGEGTRFHN